MRSLMTSLGLVIIDQTNDYPKEIRNRIEEVLKFYEELFSDVELRKAAYGIAVAATSLALNVSVRTARLLVEHALTIKELKTGA